MCDCQPLSVFSGNIYTIKIVDFSRNRTQIAWLEGEHFTTTTAPTFNDVIVQRIGILSLAPGFKLLTFNNGSSHYHLTKDPVWFCVF